MGGPRFPRCTGHRSPNVRAQSQAHPLSEIPETLHLYQASQDRADKRTPLSRAWELLGGGRQISLTEAKVLVEESEGQRDGLKICWLSHRLSRENHPAVGMYGSRPMYRRGVRLPVRERSVKADSTEIAPQRLRSIHEGWPEREPPQIQLPPMSAPEGFPHQPPRSNITPTGPLANLSLRSFTPPISLTAAARLHRPLPRRIAPNDFPPGGVQESVHQPRAVSPIELDADEGWANSMRLGTETELASFLEHGRSESESDGEGEPSRKRQKGKKTPIACNRCRSKSRPTHTRGLLIYINSAPERKIGCDGIKPQPCSSCVSKRWECIYVENQRRRGPGKAPRGTKRSKGVMPERPGSSHSAPGSRPTYPSLHGTPENLHYTFSATPAMTSLAGPPAPLPPLPSSSTPAHYHFINEQPGLTQPRRAGRRRPGSRGSTPGSFSEPAGIGRAVGSASQAHAGYTIPSSASPPRVHAALGSPPVPTGDFTFVLNSTAGPSGNLLRRSAPIYADVSRVDNEAAQARRQAGQLLSVDTENMFRAQDDESSDGGEQPPTTASSVSP